MDVFSCVDDALAITRYPKGVHKQVKVYQRRDRLYVPHAGGFVEIKAKQHDGLYSTSHPDIKLVEIECSRLTHAKHVGQDHLRREGE